MAKKWDEHVWMAQAGGYLKKAAALLAGDDLDIHDVGDAREYLDKAGDALVKAASLGKGKPFTIDYDEDGEPIVVGYE